MIQEDPILKDFESMNIKDLKKEIHLARKKISSLDSEIKNLKEMALSPFKFLLVPPPKSEPSILKQAANIEIIDSSPKINSNDDTPNQ